MNVSPVSDRNQTHVHELIDERWSPRNFSEAEPAPEALRTLFEAANSSASCFNEQPWRFVVARKSNREQWERMLGILMEKNQQWAKSAPVLGFSAGKKTFTHNGAPDRFGTHDAGMALSTMMIEAVALGLRVHGMGGFDATKAREIFHVPDDFEIGAAFAIGYPAEPRPGERKRNPLSRVVFESDWEKPASFAL
jgi:nitroreductase